VLLCAAGVPGETAMSENDNTVLARRQRSHVEPKYRMRRGVPFAR
jgi:hypothetical protein